MRSMLTSQWTYSECVCEVHIDLTVDLLLVCLRDPCWPHSGLTLSVFVRSMLTSKWTYSECVCEVHVDLAVDLL